MTSDSLTYKQAGVDIDAQEEALALSKASIKRSRTAGVLADVGLFGGLFDPAKMGCGDSVLVASADGVGTKLDVAKKVGIYDTVGRDLVQHCIDDILVQGARPLFFMDYVGTGKLEPEVVSGLIRGCADACTDNGLALLGGETAEMPGLYAEGDFDLVGFIVGAVARDRILDGSRVKSGQVLLGLPSLGLHTNGYSLARLIMFDRLGLKLDDKPEQLGGRTVAEALLAPHKSYYSALWPLLEKQQIAAMAHITGGGLIDNVPRILGGQYDAVFDRQTWERPGLFRLLVEGGKLEDDESYRAFNMGIGMVLFVDESDCVEVMADLQSRGEVVFRIGAVEDGTGTVKWNDGALS